MEEVKTTFFFKKVFLYYFRLRCTYSFCSQDQPQKMFYEATIGYDTNLQQMMLGLKLVCADESQEVKGTVVSLSIQELARLWHRSLCDTEIKQTMVIRLLKTNCYMSSYKCNISSCLWFIFTQQFYYLSRTPFKIWYKDTIHTIP